MRAQDSQSLTCPVCSAPFETYNPVSRSGPRRFCGPTCQRIHAGKRSGAKSRGTGRQVPCPRCGVPFWPWAGGDHPRRYCGGEGCVTPPRIKPPRVKQPGELRDCLHCAAGFESKSKRQQCCGKTCRVRYQSKLRKLKLRGLKAEVITAAHLRARGETHCALCGEPVDFAQHYPHPKSATVDHIKPITRGGEHGFSNVQLAHAWCNTSKGNRVATAIDTGDSHPTPAPLNNFFEFPMERGHGTAEYR